ncbi:MAG: flagellar hook-length control protein FliK [Firmicutes bacterium]|nr:flagellar hook-length control protein FliK [Bacillota bacterium]
MSASVSGPAILEQLADHLREMVASISHQVGPDRVHRAAIRLRPEHLGEVVLRISVDSQGIVNARFLVDNPAVQAAIERELPKLQAALGEHGLQLGQASVDSGPGSGGGGLTDAGGFAWGYGDGDPQARWTLDSAGQRAGIGPEAETDAGPAGATTAARELPGRLALIDIRA